MNTYKIPKELVGKAKSLWKQIIPNLLGEGKLKPENFLMLEQGFLLLQEFYNIQANLIEARKRNDQKEIDNINAQFVRTSRACTSIFEKLGFSPTISTTVEVISEQSLLQEIIKDGN